MIQGVASEQKASASIVSQQVTTQAIVHNQQYSSKWDFVAGCAIVDKSCKCYSYNASIVRDVSEKECKEYIQGYKPLVSHTNVRRDNVIYEDPKPNFDNEIDVRQDNSSSASALVSSE